MKKVVIIGAGPAGLFSAYLLLKKGFKVEVYDHSSGPLKKFLVAGNGGLNLTHSEDLEAFSLKYQPHEKLFTELINEFTPSDLRAFCTELGVQTFVGSSGRVFPKKLNAAEILLAWVSKLKENSNFTMFLNHSFSSFKDNHEIEVEHENKKLKIKGDFFIFALGGASWKKTGSNGAWVHSFKEIGIKLGPFLPMNSGFECSWSDYFKEKIDYKALKNITLEFKGKKIRGEAMLTPFGIEGGGVYAHSKELRDEILEKGSCLLKLDLKPDLTFDEIQKKIEQQPAKASLSNSIRKALGFEGEINILLKECYPNLKKEEVSKSVKNIELLLTGIRPIDEAISTSGGVLFCELSEFLELKKRKRNYIVGEMLDFEAPTGGYLIQASFSTAFRAVKGIIQHS